MYELLLIVCVGARFCDFVASPILYPTESRCAVNAALVAGTVGGRYSSSLEHGYRFLCRSDNEGDTSWTVVHIRDAILDEGNGSDVASAK